MVKFRVAKCVQPWNYGLYKVQKHNWLWGWEDFGDFKFKSYETAISYIMDIRKING